MSVLSRKQKKCIDKLFRDSAALERAVKDIRATVHTTAEQSADPTARQAVVNMEEIPEAMGYKRPEAWLRVVELTWARYHSEHYIGRAMRRRYIKRESAETICMMEHMAVPTFWRMRDEFLIYAAFCAVREGLL